MKATRLFKCLQPARVAATVAATTLSLLILPALASAGAFTVSPTQIYMSPENKTAILKVTNQGDGDVGLQMNAVDWSMSEDGQNTFTPVKDIAFFPKITRVAKGETRTIRVGYMGKPGASEKAFRMFVQEIPTASDTGMGLRVALRMSVPIFVTPAKPVLDGNMDNVHLADGSLMATMNNTGNVHIIVKKVSSTGKDEAGGTVFSNEQGGWYVLAGKKRTYRIDLNEEECLKASTATVALEIDNSVLRKEIKIDPRQCRHKE